VAEKEEKSASIPWLPLITLIGVGSGLLLFFPQLTSSRPGGGEPQLAEKTFDDQTVDARLWQDPLGVAIASQQKEEKQNSTHSIKSFQELLINKCFAESAEQANRVEIFAVMVPGGPYVEDVERRLRSRRAVVEGLSKAGYNPEKDHEIGYFSVPWPPLQPSVTTCVALLEANRNNDEGHRIASVQMWATRGGKEPETHNLLVPYEWCEPGIFQVTNPKTGKPFDVKKPIPHILLLWLTDDAFGDAPLARLADLISWFRLTFYDYGRVDSERFLVYDYGRVNSVPLPVFNVLGPDNSGTLRKMVLEAKEDTWNDDTRECLTTTHVYSSQAGAAES
jgi:hypothetical protein